MALTDGLISYWKLDESSGDAIDSHGSNDGTVTGATQGATGKINDAYSFDGTDDKIVIGQPANLDLDEEISISAWIKADAVGRHNPIVAKWYGTNGQNSILLTVNDDASPSTLYFLVGASGSWVCVASSEIITAGNWFHIVGVLSVAGGYGKLYVDGDLKSTDSSVSAASWGAYDWTIGYEDEGTDEKFDGVIDEVGIWDRPLLQADVTSLYNSGSGLAYPFSAGPDFTKMQIKIGDAWKAGAGMQINIGDAWKEVAGAQINIGDAWKTIF